MVGAAFTGEVTDGVWRNWIVSPFETVHDAFDGGQSSWRKVAKPRRGRKVENRSCNQKAGEKRSQCVRVINIIHATRPHLVSDGADR